MKKSELRKIIKEELLKEGNLRKTESGLSEMYFYYIDERQGDFSGMGKWLAEAMVELYRSPTYGDYQKERAQSDLNDFIKGWKSVNKKI